MQSSLFLLKKSARDLQAFLFFKQHFYEQQQAKIGKKYAKAKQDTEAELYRKMPHKQVCLFQ